MNLSKFFKFPTSRPKLAPEPRTETNTPYYELADRVEIVQHARAAGLSNLPHPLALTPNDVETAIEHEFRNRHRVALESARGDLRAIVEDFAKLEDQLPTPRDLKVLPTNAAAGTGRTLAADQTIGHTRRELQERHRNERAFRRQHGLVREARFPESMMMHLAIVAVLVLVESVLNMGFFAATSAFGLVGGLLMAVGVSLVNAASGVVAGFLCFRHLHVPRGWTKSAASFGVGLYVVTAVVFNLAVAHFRDLSAPTAGVAGQALTAALEHPFALSTPSVGLLILGLVVSAIAVWHGYTLDDPCPGYGDVVRARRRAADAFKAANESLRQRGLAPVEAVPVQCDAVVKRAQGVVEQLRDLAVRAKRREERYETDRSHNDHWCTALLRKYRSENESVRTAPAPKYFAEYPPFPSELDGAVVADLGLRLDQARAALDALASRGHDITRQQPERMATTHRRLDDFARTAVRGADAGRGDGSEPADIEWTDAEGRRA